MSRLEEVFIDGEVLKSDSLNRIVDAINELKDSCSTPTEGEWTAKPVVIENLDQLNNLTENTTYYTVYYQNNPIGTLRVFGNSVSSIVTQILDANWDIDVSGNLLPDYEAVELKSFIRTYNISSEKLAGEIPIGAWGKWKLNQKVIAPQGGIIIE